jgi:RNA polymerase sigma-70 factor, ECF subfamily
MASQPTSGRCRRRRSARPKVAVTAPPPPSGVVTANLRGSPTALRARWEPLPASRPCIPLSFVVRTRGHRSDSGPVRFPHVPPAGPALPTSLPDEDLVEQARTDPEAFAELYRRYVPRVHAFVYRRSRSSELAEEITASTFERALRALPGFRWRDGGFQAWLYRIAANELASHYRRAQRQHSERGQRAARQLHEDAPATEPTLDGGDGSAVLEALGQLNERYQRAITLRYLSGLTPEDAAHAMGLSKATFAVVLHRAMGALRKVIDQQPEEGS